MVLETQRQLPSYLMCSALFCSPSIVLLVAFQTLLDLCPRDRLVANRVAAAGDFVIAVRQQPEDMPVNFTLCRKVLDKHRVASLEEMIDDTH